MIDLTHDCHAHILPGCDHGSDGIGTSLRQIAMARDAGIRTICATPHFYPHIESPAAFLERRGASAAELKAALAPGSPSVELGAEVLICDGLDRLEELGSLCREGTNELLLEMPFYSWQDPVRDTLLRLHDRNDLQIVIAHADRYPVGDIEELIAEGIALQLNVSCLRSPLRRIRYLSWIRDGYVRCLGSDIHMIGSGYRDWKKCIPLINKLR